MDTDPFDAAAKEAVRDAASHLAMTVPLQFVFILCLLIIIAIQSYLDWQKENNVHESFKELYRLCFPHPSGIADPSGILGEIEIPVSKE